MSVYFSSHEAARLRAQILATEQGRPWGVVRRLFNDGRRVDRWDVVPIEHVCLPPGREGQP